MKYLLIEFLGIFTMVLQRTITNIDLEHESNKSSYIFNYITSGILLMIFYLIAVDKSQGLFNPTFAIVQNMWSKLSTSQTLGYLAAHFISAFLAISVLVWLLPEKYFMNVDELFFGMKKIQNSSDFVSVCTVEIIGSFFIYFTYIYYQEIEKNRVLGACALGFITIAFNFATYEISGGAFNIALLVGSMIFENVFDYRFLGCIIARLFVQSVWYVKQELNQGKAIKMLLREEEDLADK